MRISRLGRRHAGKFAVILLAVAFVVAYLGIRQLPGSIHQTTERSRAAQAAILYSIIQLEIPNNLTTGTEAEQYKARIEAADQALNDSPKNISLPSGLQLQIVKLSLRPKQDIHALDNKKTIDTYNRARTFGQYQARMNKALTPILSYDAKMDFQGVPPDSETARNKVELATRGINNALTGIGEARNIHKEDSWPATQESVRRLKSDLEQFSTTGDVPAWDAAVQLIQKDLITQRSESWQMEWSNDLYPALSQDLETTTELKDSMQALRIRHRLP